MKFVSVADTHGFIFEKQVPSCDILTISGDITPLMYDGNYTMQKLWFHDLFIPQLRRLLKFTNQIILVAGNHDRYLFQCYLDQNNDEIRNALPSRVHYLCNDNTTVRGVNFYGNPFVPYPDDKHTTSWADKKTSIHWNFARHDKDMKGFFDVNPNTDVVVTHTPIFGFCDELSVHGILAQNLGSVALKESIYELNVKFCLSGHIHSGTRDFMETPFKCLCACTSLMDNDLYPSNTPKVFEYV